MKLNWYINKENHSSSIPADILYLGNRWNIKFKKILIVGTLLKYTSIFNELNITCWNLEELKKQSQKPVKSHFDYILCYHSLSGLYFQECKKLLSFLSNILTQDGEIYLTLLSKDSYFFKNKIKTDNNLYVNQKELESLLTPFAIKNIEYTKRIKQDNKINPHFYILATKLSSNNYHH